MMRSMQYTFSIISLCGPLWVWSYMTVLVEHGNIACKTGCSLQKCIYEMKLCATHVNQECNIRYWKILRLVSERTWHKSYQFTALIPRVKMPWAKSWSANVCICRWQHNRMYYLYLVHLLGLVRLSQVHFSHP